MKVTIDASTFNKAIRQGKLELAEWLITNSCPVDSSVYIQNFDITILHWLKSKDIQIPKNCLSDVIDKTGDLDVIKWFQKNGAIINSNCLNSCIRNSRNTLFFEFLQKNKIPDDAFKVAILSENIQILDFLKEKIKIDEEIVEIAMKNKKKESLKWLVLNDLFS